MRTKPCLTSADVQKIVAACKADADKNKWKVSIAVVDDAGNLLHFERPDDVRVMTIEIAIGKARTSALTAKPSRELQERIKDRPGMVKIRNTLPMQGGVPLLYQGTCVGAVGVSGVQSHEDEQVANAGAAVLG